MLHTFAVLKREECGDRHRVPLWSSRQRRLGEATLPGGIGNGFKKGSKVETTTYGWAPSAAMIIRCSKLTTCGALDHGEAVKLEFLDQGGNPVSLLLSFEDAESISMTLPR